MRCDPLSSWSAVDRKTLNRAIEIILHIHRGESVENFMAFVYFFLVLQDIK